MLNPLLETKDARSTQKIKEGRTRVPTRWTDLIKKLQQTDNKKHKIEQIGNRWEKPMSNN